MMCENISSINSIYTMYPLSIGQALLIDIDIRSQTGRGSRSGPECSRGLQNWLDGMQGVFFPFFPTTGTYYLSIL